MVIEREKGKLIALLEVRGDQRSLAFALTTAIEWMEMYKVYAWCHGDYGWLCKIVNLLTLLTLGVNQNLFVLFFVLMVAKCFYFSGNLFPGFGYGKAKCVFTLIWPYTWYMKTKIWGKSGIV